MLKNSLVSWPDVILAARIPRKGGPGISQSDLLVINKVRIVLHYDGEPCLWLV